MTNHSRPLPPSPPPARRQRIRVLTSLGFSASKIIRELEAAETAPLPPELSESLQALVDAARAVVAMSERELAFLEAARDWAGDDL